VLFELDGNTSPVSFTINEDGTDFSNIMNDTHSISMGFKYTGFNAYESWHYIRPPQLEEFR